eukprot:gene98-102_t
MIQGRCHCGAIQFEMPGQAVHSTICHCDDCRRQSGAPMMAWAMVPAISVAVRGEPKMGMLQVRIAALNDPNAIAPKMQVQTAEEIGWMKSAHSLPAFERFPA